MDLTNRRRVPYIDAGFGVNRHQEPSWTSTEPMVTLPVPTNDPNWVSPMEEYADDPVINSIIEQHRRRRRTTVPLDPLTLMQDQLRGRSQ